MTALELAQVEKYQGIADRMRTDARAYLALVEEVQDRPELLTFRTAYAEGLRRRYRDLAEFCHEAAYQAQAIADAYVDHADSPLRSVGVS